MRKAGLRVEIVGDGQAAIERLLHTEDAHFDVVLMDMMMPIKDGYQATRELRAAGFTRPIVALTAHAIDSERETCLACGCDGFVTKPIERNGLLQVLHTWLPSGAPD